jgi:transposase-like protein
MKYTFKEFQKQYRNDDTCLDAVLQRRYGNAEACPHCGVIGKLTRIEKRRAYACKEGCHIYPCAGTIFEHSPTPLTQWFHAIYLMTTTRNGVAAKELQRQLGVTYKCAWRIGHQLRILMAARDKANTPDKLSGHVEIDETYIGGKTRVKTKIGRRNQGLHLENKTVVMGMVQRGGAFKGQVVPDGKKPTLLPVVLKNVQPGTMINTDNNSAYDSLKKLGYRHESVNHTMEEWRRGIHHTNRIEGFWSHLKRGISSTHVWVSRKHMQKYVNEFAFRYNNRHQPAEMFARLLAQVSMPTSY